MVAENLDEQFGGNLHLNAVGGVDAAALHAADARRGHGHGLLRRFHAKSRSVVLSA